MNLIVLCSDTFRVDHLSCYRDDSPVHTPNIDRLAAEGVRFDSAFGEGTPTLPARRVLYTGRPIFPFLWAPQKWDRVQLPGWHPLFYEDVTLAEWLVERGYVTGLISDLPHQFKPGKNFHRGFMQFNWERGQEMDYLVAGPRNTVPVERFDPTGRATPVLTQFLMNSRDWKDETDWCSVRVLRKGIDFLRENAGQQPFMLWLECFFPHEPWFAPPELVEQHYEGDDHDGVEWIFPPAITDGMSENQVHRVRAHYRGLCALIDRWFGRLMETAEKLGLLDNSIIVFLSDHGTMMGEQGQLHKGPDRLRWQCTQVPLIIRHPNVDAFGGSVVDAFVQHQDLMPTLLGLIDIDSPDRCLGEDLWSYVRGDKDGGRGHVITAFGNYASIRGRNWNYQTPWAKNDPKAADGNQPALSPPELYDLDSDPEELKNVVKDHHRSVLLDMRHQQVVDAFVQHQDLMPTLLGLIDIDSPDRCLGEDLWPYVRGDKDGGRDHVITAFGNYASVRGRNWNYQTPWAKNDPKAADGNQPALSPPELYDLNSDPEELKNVVKDHPDVALEYHDLLMAYVEKNRPATGGSLEAGNTALSHVPLFDQSRL